MLHVTAQLNANSPFNPSYRIALQPEGDLGSVELQRSEAQVSALLVYLADAVTAACEMRRAERWARQRQRLIRELREAFSDLAETCTDSDDIVGVVPGLGDAEDLYLLSFAVAEMRYTLSVDTSDVLLLMGTLTQAVELNS